jgi:hypothetical protein
VTTACRISSTTCTSSPNASSPQKHKLIIFSEVSPSSSAATRGLESAIYSYRSTGTEGMNCILDGCWSSLFVVWFAGWPSCFLRLSLLRMRRISLRCSRRLRCCILSVGEYSSPLIPGFNGFREKRSNNK